MGELTRVQLRSSSFGYRYEKKIHLGSRGFLKGVMQHVRSDSKEFLLSKFRDTGVISPSRYKTLQDTSETYLSTGKTKGDPDQTYR